MSLICSALGLSDCIFGDSNVEAIVGGSLLSGLYWLFLYASVRRLLSGAARGSRPWPAYTLMCFKTLLVFALVGAGLSHFGAHRLGFVFGIFAGFIVICLVFYLLGLKRYLGIKSIQKHC